MWIIIIIITSSVMTIAASSIECREECPTMIMLMVVVTGQKELPTPAAFSVHSSEKRNPTGDPSLHHHQYGHSLSIGADKEKNTIQLTNIMWSQSAIDTDGGVYSGLPIGYDARVPFACLT